MMQNNQSARSFEILSLRVVKTHQDSTPSNLVSLGDCNSCCFSLLARVWLLVLLFSILNLSPLRHFAKVLRSMSQRSGRFCLTIIWRADALVGRLEGQSLNIHPFWELALDAWPKPGWSWDPPLWIPPIGWKKGRTSSLVFFSSTPSNSCLLI